MLLLDNIQVVAHLLASYPFEIRNTKLPDEASLPPFYKISSIMIWEHYCLMKKLPGFYNKNLSIKIPFELNNTMIFFDERILLVYILRFNLLESPPQLTLSIVPIIHP